MSKRNLVMVIALLLAIPVLLVGCGKSESAAVEDTIRGFVAAFNAGDTEKCTEYAAGITDDLAKATLKAFLDGAKAGVEKIEIVSIKDVKVNGSTATASVTHKTKLAASLGGTTQEGTIEGTLTKEDGKWKLGIEDFFQLSG